MSYYNIPEELRARPQFVLWRLTDIGAHKPSKIPYQLDGSLASVTEPSTWCSFEQAVGAAHNYSGIGYVFTENDPYTFIDLDTTDDPVVLNQQIEIFKQFDSYSEVSPSGKGLHIIIKGHVPQGRRRNYVEIYSSARYATMTGNVHLNKPIAYRQEVLLSLWEQMGAGAPQAFQYHGNEKENGNDKEIVERALNAANGEKFKYLLDGEWSNLYPSQSEADYAFINIISFYTQNRNQIRRLFRQSALGARPKAKRDKYVDAMIDHSFDRLLPLIDFDGFKISVERALNEQKRQIINSDSNDITNSSFISSDIRNFNNSKIAGSSNGKTPLFESENKGSIPLPAAKLNGNSQINSPTIYHPPLQIPIPPGIMGEIAKFIYEAAPRPVPEMAIAGALGLMAGICGRAYNISATGLNQYVLLIAATGTGKEQCAVGIDRLMNAIKLMVPTSTNFIGPSEISSGQALVKELNKNPCFVSILGEFGLRLQSMSNPHAHNSEVMLKRILLDLFNKSGFGQTFRRSIYSDKDKNIDATNAPSFSILGESTPERFYDVLNEDMISEGLLPRFMIIEYKGIRVPLNPNHMQAKPTFQLIERFAGLVAQVEMIMHAKKVIDISSDEASTKIFEDFDRHCDLQINGTSKEILRQLWNRAHIKALKIAALIAVGVNMADPIVIPEYAHWAINMVVNDIRALSYKFEMGEIGASSSEIKQIEDIKKMLKEFVTADWDIIGKYKVDERLFKNKIIPWQYIHRRLGASAVFRNDKAGATFALKRAIQTLLDSDTIREIGRNDLSAKYGTSQRVFVIRDNRILE